MAGKGKKKNKGAGNNGLKSKMMVMSLSLIILAAIFLASTIVIVVCMIPTLVATLVDRQPQKTAWITVGAMNFAGTLPAWFDLWSAGHTISNAMTVITTPMILIVAYGAAAVGVAIYQNITPFVAMVLVGKNEKRLKVIKKRQKELVRKWGDVVMR